jgi:hypothetical protein
MSRFYPGLDQVLARCGKTYQVLSRFLTCICRALHLYRWFGQSRSSPDQVTELATPFVAKLFKQESRGTPGPLSEREKYRRAQQTFGRIGSELTRFSDDAFESAMTHFDEWWHNMRQGKITAVTVGDAAEETNDSVANEEDGAVIGAGDARAGCSRSSGGSETGGT